MCETCRQNDFMRDEIDAYERKEQGMDELPQLAPGTIIKLTDMLADERWVVLNHAAFAKELPGGLYAMNLRTFELIRMCRQGDPTRSGFVTALGTIVASEFADAEASDPEKVDAFLKSLFEDLPTDPNAN